MSDTSNRGRILFLVMTNRPDKLDVDLKRAGRLDRKIPFLYSQTPEEVEAVAKALVKKNRLKSDVDFATIRDAFSAKLVGYSNADVEAVVLMANDDAAREAGGDAPVTAEHFEKAAADYFPSRDAELLEYMELLAVFEASSRRLLPPKYAHMTPGGAGRAAPAPPGDGREPEVGREARRWLQASGTRGSSRTVVSSWAGTAAGGSAHGSRSPICWRHIA